MNKIIIEIDGKRYEGWTNMESSSGMDEIAGTFQFTATASMQSSFPIKNGAGAKVFVNGTQTHAGNVETVVVAYTAIDHRISISGRDITGDIVDSKLSKSIEFTKNTTLVSVIEKALADLNFDLKVENTAGDIEPFALNELVSSTIGEGAFEFMSKYAQKRQVLLGFNGIDTIQIFRASQEKLPVKLTNKIGAKDNNILNATVIYDQVNRFNKVQIFSQDNTVQSEASPSETVDKTTVQFDTQIRSSRQTAYVIGNTLNQTDGQKLADWYVNIARGRSITYQANVQGFEYATGEIWKKNKLVRVEDDFANIYSYMLIRKVNFIQSSAGTFTVLELVPPDAFTLKPNIVQENFNQVGL